MYIITRKTALLIFMLMIAFSYSCMDLDELNENPNGVKLTNGHPNLLLSTIESYTGVLVVEHGFGDLAGVMQHTQKDGWSSSHNSYDWTTDQSWDEHYGILRNIDDMYNKSVDMNLKFHHGAALVLKAYVFGMITDLWGDAPFTNALRGDLGGEESIKPTYDRQQDIYNWIIEDLEAANDTLSLDKSEFVDVDEVQDILLGGNVEKWRKFANSLALRYYMRLSEKDPDKAREGINKIVNNPDKYPLILNAQDDVNMSYVGGNKNNSWPTNTVYQNLDKGEYRRRKMCSTLVDTLQALNDPRLPLWARKVDIPLVAVNSPADRDDIVDDVRYVGPECYAVLKYDSLYSVYDESNVLIYKARIDYDQDYVGFPPAWSAVPQAYNLYKTGQDVDQAPKNSHASLLNERYKKASGPLLKARLITAAEVNFIIAEAKLKGWAGGGSAQSHYQQGIQASFDAWGVGAEYADYLLNEGVVYDGTIEQIMEQKWIASWTAAAESWFDYRRTGLPALQPGHVVKRKALPLRLYYAVDELDYNTDNVQSAINLLEETAFVNYDGKNSAWSKMWLLQGTGNPY